MFCKTVGKSFGAQTTQKSAETSRLKEFGRHFVDALPSIGKCSRIAAAISVILGGVSCGGTETYSIGCGDQDTKSGIALPKQNVDVNIGSVGKDGAIKGNRTKDTVIASTDTFHEDTTDIVSSSDVHYVDTVASDTSKSKDTGEPQDSDGSVTTTYTCSLDFSSMKAILDDGGLGLLPPDVQEATVLIDDGNGILHEVSVSADFEVIDSKCKTDGIDCSFSILMKNHLSVDGSIMEPQMVAIIPQNKTIGAMLEGSASCQVITDELCDVDFTELSATIVSDGEILGQSIETIIPIPQGNGTYKKQSVVAQIKSELPACTVLPDGSCEVKPLTAVLLPLDSPVMNVLIPKSFILSVKVTGAICNILYE